jgi:folate-binding protein YgfZ
MAMHEHPNEEQVAWLTASVGVFVTSDRVVRLVGEDCQSWLNGQVTADVRELNPGTASYALTVSLKGRVQSDLWAVREPGALSPTGPDGLAVVLPATCQEVALQAFEKHIIMEDVELVPAPGLRVLSVQGPKASALVEQLGAVGTLYPCARLAPLPGFDLWLTETELPQLLERCAVLAGQLGGGLLDAAGWAHAHVALGVARAGIDFGSDTYPQEAGLKARAVSFNKGCYTGQEVVYMLEKRGQLARRLVQLRGPGVATAAGGLVTDADGLRVGEVTSSTQSGAHGLALAYVKRVHAHAGAALRIAEQAWEVCCVLGESDAGCPIVASP